MATPTNVQNGKITQVIGPVVDVEFPAGGLPEIYTACTVTNPGINDRTDGFIQKMYADELGFRAADRWLQVHGGIGLTTDLPIEQFWRQSRSFRITEGPTEIMKMVIARNVLREYG